ncbi:MAG: cysteine--tRNA ligase [Thermoanaerobaculia bacterium]|nr:cysteine--tRNA ligase [Thermoanaerobaculia bacterium]
MFKLFNTLTRKIESFEPSEEGHVRYYACGPTVYNYVHIGNLRTLLWNDVLRRYLEWKGYRVTYVMNITDIDDKIIRGAAEKNVDIRAFAEPYTEAFFDNLKTLRIRRADIHPKATEHIESMVSLVEALAERGHTYDADGSVYFDISSFEGYGKLSRVDVSVTGTVSRIESDEYEKDNVRDFVLWKGKKEGEPSWDVSIGEGRPGWHLECSAMSMEYLGDTFDIHSGAVDLIFPHHENEVAQSEGSTGKPFVRYWVHGEHLIVEGEKMSKSLGNFYTLPDLLEKEYSPLQIRYSLLAVPYRTKLNFTMKSLEDASHALERLELFLLRMRQLADSGEPVEGDQGSTLASGMLESFEEAMDDDLNTAGALGAIFGAIRDANTSADENRIGSAGAKALLEALERTDEVLDIFPEEQEDLDAEIQEMVDARDEARRRRDFAESDRLRDELHGRGIILEDTPQGTRWRRK